MTKKEWRSLQVLSRLYVDDHIKTTEETARLRKALHSNDEGRKANILKLIHVKAQRAYRQ